MKTADVLRLTPLERFIYFIQERESIRLKRSKGLPKPWTDDEILQRYRFTNVRRMDDKVSQWLLENWYKPNYNHHNMLAAVCLARFINQPSTLEEIGFPAEWKPDWIKSSVRYLQAMGGSVYNSAYMVRGNDGQDKIETIVDYTIGPLIDDPPTIDRGSMEKTWEEIESRYGFGSFMAGQVVADLRWAMEGTWKDKRKWAPMGPGSKRGMNRLQGRETNAGIKQNYFLAELRKLVAESSLQLPKGITSRLEMIDWQNCLCEYDKVERVLFGEGRPKSLYQGV